MSDVFIGIDPGWRNLGLSIVSNNKLETFKLNPSYFPNMLAFTGTVVEMVRQRIDFGSGQRIFFCMERYVSYNDKLTADSEKILLLTGALCQAVGTISGPEVGAVEVRMFRAIDWKQALCKHLVHSKGFKNPSKNMDKKFSFAACCASWDVEQPETDHEADSACLAYMPVALGLVTL